MLRIFLDCNRCDEEYMRQNVGFVDYVRDRTVADVHVLVTTERTGSNGLRWVVKFIGQDRLKGEERSLTFTTDQTATEDDQRKAFARVFRIGLVAAAMGTTAAPQLDVTWTKPAGAASTAPKKDPWNYWVFSVNVNGNRNGEKSSASTSSYFSVNANRTTEAWKIRSSAYRNENTNRFEIDDETTVRSSTHSWGWDGLVVKSLSPHWSAGMTASVSHSSFNNFERSSSFTPGIEFNVFPYKDSARRSLIVKYRAGPTRNRYTEPTVYDKTSEVVLKHFVQAGMSLKQPWGSLYISSNFSQDMKRPERYRESIYGNTDVRIFKGFSVNFYGEYNKIADQISLKKDTASETDVLLRLRQLQTNYSYYMGFGVSYSFGSIFNSVVNPRFTF